MCWNRSSGLNAGIALLAVVVVAALLEPVDPLNDIHTRSCMFCMSPAVAAVINTRNFGPVCARHAERARLFGYQVTWPEDYERQTDQGAGNSDRRQPDGAPGHPDPDL